MSCGSAGSVERHTAIRGQRHASKRQWRDPEPERLHVLMPNKSCDARRQAAVNATVAATV
jgi:hypothetical protein